MVIIIIMIIIVPLWSTARPTRGTTFPHYHLGVTRCATRPPAAIKERSNVPSLFILHLRPDFPFLFCFVSLCGISFIV
jgi:hypothetical protein